MGCLGSFSATCLLASSQPIMVPCNRVENLYLLAMVFTIPTFARGDQMLLNVDVSQKSNCLRWVCCRRPRQNTHIQVHTIFSSLPSACT